MPDEDDPLGADWALLSGRETRPTYDDELLDAMRSVRETCERLVQHGDPTPQQQAAISLVRQAATIASQVGRQGEPPLVVGRIAAARLALLGFAVRAREEGMIIRMRDRWAAIFLEIRHAASRLPAGDARRNELAAALADRIMLIAGCEEPPDVDLVRAAIEGQPEPRPEDEVLLRIMSTVNLPSASADSLARSIRGSLPFVRGLRAGTDGSGGHGT